MKYLGIDYGRKKIGLAVSDGVIAEPMKIQRYKDIKILRDKIENIIKELEIEKVVIGMPEGKMGEEIKRFSLDLRTSLSGKGIEIIEWDESLTTQMAQKLSIEAGIKRKKRREMEDAYSAALILQSYLDTL